MYNNLLKLVTQFISSICEFINFSIFDVLHMFIGTSFIILPITRKAGTSNCK